MTTATFTSDLVGIGVPWPLATYFATGRVEFNGINALTAGITPFPIAGLPATTATGAGGAITITSGSGGATSGVGGSMAVSGGAGGGTGAGGAAAIAGGNSGAGATGNGGVLALAGGTALSTNGSGGAVLIASGASTGTGVGSNVTLTPGTVSTGARGTVVLDYLRLDYMPAPTALTSGVTLTAAQLLARMLTSVPGGAANANYQLPTATAFEAAFASVATDRGFEFVIINTSAVAAETCTITTNTGWTLVGNMVVQSNNASTNVSTGRFAARRTAANTFTLYRV